MQLFSSAGTLFRWLADIIGVFLRVRPLITIMTIVVAAVTQVMTLVSFFLPLKVLLLAGSTSIPKYFQAFVNEENRTDWLVVLTVAAVSAWLLVLLLQDLSGRLSSIGARKVLEGANELASARKFQNDARDFYGKFCQIAADLLFGLIVLAVLAMISWPVVLTVIGLIISVFAFASIVLATGDPVHPGRLHRFILNDYGELILVSGSVVFVGAFLVLLYPFLVGASANVLLSILCVLLLRQGIRFSGNSIRDLVSLYSSRHIIEPLIFRHKPSVRVEDPTEQNLRILFPKSKRDELARERLISDFDSESRFDSHWEDSSVPGVFFVRIVVSDARDSIRYFQQQVYAENQSRLLEHEDVLFRYLRREAIWAPMVHDRFQHGGFECQICDYGDGRGVDGKSWAEAERNILQRVWSAELPDELVEGFRVSEQVLADRLDSAAFQRLQVAVDTDVERESLGQFLECLPSVTETLNEVPYCVVNPHLNMHNVARNGESFQVMNWCRWRIEPIGTQLPARIDDEALQGMLQQVAQERGMDSADLSVDKIRLVKECATLDHAVARMKYKAALQQMQLILKRYLVGPA